MDVGVPRNVKRSKGNLKMFFTHFFAGKMISEFSFLLNFNDFMRDSIFFVSILNGSFLFNFTIFLNDRN